MSSINKNYINMTDETKRELSKMSDGDRLNFLMQSYETEERCEVCGSGLTVIKALGKKICVECEKNKHLEVVQNLEDEWTLNAWKTKTWAYFDEYSVIKNKGIKKAGFTNYDTNEEQVAKAKNIAKQFIGNILKDIPKHMVLSGDPGRGKSHLAMATVRSLLEMSQYTRKGIYIHYASYLELTRSAIEQKELKNYVKDIKKAIIECDVLVLDDLGVDLGNVDNPKEASDWNMQELNLILEAREEKALIVTTNFDEAKIKHAYGKRNHSRLFMKSKGFRISFNNVIDKRLDM